ncbi:MAG: T9SS type A sorting domain-containing protein [Bacteroidetes bacterium]|nr:T9SS type A sorting domain-containing protein [Bacteroidota bacterium]
MRRKILTILFLLSFCAVHAERYLSLPGSAIQNTNFNEVKIGDSDILRWQSTTVGWYLNQNGAGDGLTFQQTYNAVNAAFNSWQAISTSSMSFAYQNLTTRGWANDGYNVVYWAEAGDDIYSLTPQRRNMALTYITSDASHNIVDVDIIFTGLNTDPYGNPFSWHIDGTYGDIQAIATHEIGHMIGIAHTDVNSSPLPTMSATYNGVDERSLEFDDIKAASFLYDGNILDNETPQYSPSFRWPITVSLGKTLTITSGKNVTFTNNATMTVNGSVNVTSSTFHSSGGSSIVINGSLYATSSTFTGLNTPSYWQGIIFNSGSTGNLNGCTINNVYTYASGAVKINNSSPTIQNCIIENNSSTTYGMYVMNNAAPILNNNTIRNNTYDAIVFDHAGGYLTNNKITASNGTASINCWDNANPTFSTSGGSTGLNLLQNGAYGIYADWYSTPNAGTSSNQSSNNKLLDATAYNATASGYSTVYAKYNYWSPFPPMRIGADAGCAVYWDPYLTTPPFSIIALPDFKEKNLLNKTVESINDNDDLLQAADLKSKKRYSEAISIYRQLLDKDINEYLASTALVELGHIYRETKNGELFDYIKSFVIGNKTTKGIAIDLVVNILQEEGQFDTAKLLNDELLGSNFKKTRFAMKGNLNLFHIYYAQGNYTLAKDILTELKTAGEWNIGINTAGLLMDEIDQRVSPNDRLVKQVETNSINSDFSLEQSYPNPFNPTTKISFSLPQKSQIKLKVFDVLGREIQILADGIYEAGKHEVEFIATNLPSGVYFYNLTNGTNSITKKMLLIK